MHACSQKYLYAESVLTLPGLGLLENHRIGGGGASGPMVEKHAVSHDIKFLSILHDILYI